MNSNKSLQEMTIKDDFMFYALMNDNELCRELLEMVLDKKIESIDIYPQNTMIYNPNYHGVRLDVIALEAGSRKKYNVEMQTFKKDSLPKRTRYYHSQIDMDMLKSGELYKSLTETYVIFICDFDPFNDGLYRYHFVMKCLENGRMLEDGKHTIFLNSHGYINDQTISDKLITFLNYVANPKDGSDADDLFVQKINRRISDIRVNREWEAQYMLLEETIREAREEGAIRTQIKYVLKQIKKQKTVEEIIDLFDEDPNMIRKIYDVIMDLNEFEDVDVIYDNLQ